MSHLAIDGSENIVSVESSKEIMQTVFERHH